MTQLTVADVEYLASCLAKRYQYQAGSAGEPALPGRSPNVLESCVVTPFQRFAGRPLYPSLLAKASVLFYFLIKNRPFPANNKRIAITTLLAFLSLNGKWLRVDTPELFSFAVWVAQSPVDFKEQVVDAVKKFIQKHLVDLI
jgi:death on curing protein